MGPVVVKVCMQGSVLLARRRRPPALRRLAQLPPPQPATPPTHTPQELRAKGQLPPLEDLHRRPTSRMGLTIPAGQHAC